MENECLEKKCFNNNSLLLDKKLFPILIIGYIILVICGIINAILFYKNIHDNINIVIMFSVCPAFLSWIYWIIKLLSKEKDGDLEYLQNYYPEIYKKLSYFDFKNKNRGGYNIFNFSDFKNGYLTDEYNDDILLEMCDRWRIKWNLLLICPVILFVLFIAITIINS